MKMSEYLRKIEIPGKVPNFRDVPDHMCAMYARRAAEELFGLVYNPADAWDFRYHNAVIWTPETDMEWKKVAKPGHILGIFNPGSVHNTSVDGEKDIMGNDRLYTHLALYAGDNAIIQQYAEHTSAFDTKRFLEAGFRVAEVLAPPKNSKCINESIYVHEARASQPSRLQLEKAFQPIH